MEKRIFLFYNNKTNLFFLSMNTKIKVLYILNIIIHLDINMNL